MYCCTIFNSKIQHRHHATRNNTRLDDAFLWCLCHSFNRSISFCFHLKFHGKKKYHLYPLYSVIEWKRVWVFSSWGKKVNSSILSKQILTEYSCSHLPSKNPSTRKTIWLFESEFGAIWFSFRVFCCLFFSALVSFDRVISKKMRKNTFP